MSDGQTRVSNTEMTVFRECRRKWWLQYVLKIAPRAKSFSGPLPLGSRVHSALESYYKYGEDLLSAYRRLVQQDREEMMSLGVPEDSEFNDEAELGRIMLEGYKEWVAAEGVDSDLEVIGVEEILEYPMLDDQVIVQAKLDLRVVKTFSGTRSILDHKTARSLTDFDKTSHMTTQLKLYMLLDKLLNDDPDSRIDGGIYRLLKKVKRTARATPPFYRDVYVHHNDFTLRSFWFQLQGVLRDMLASRRALESGADPMTVAYPSPSNTCSWKCSYYHICPLFDDGSDVDMAISDQFDVVDPYSYYRRDEDTSDL